MLIDSHCHLNFIDLKDYNDNLDTVISQSESEGVSHFLSVCVALTDYPELEKIASKYKNVSISVGVHPNEETEVSAEKLIALAANPSCIAIGETGLDYYRTESPENQTLQRNNFREHIRAALALKKPLIIHTRQAAHDTLQVLQEENAKDIGGVMHCFSEDWEIAKKAMDLNFHISFSGILTFKNATVLHEVAKKVPKDRMLIETDSPWLAPVPFRGKPNYPGFVKYVAMALAKLRNSDYETIAMETTENFYRCFRDHSQDSDVS